MRKLARSNEKVIEDINKFFKGDNQIHFNKTPLFYFVTPSQSLKVNIIDYTPNATERNWIESAYQIAMATWTKGEIGTYRTYRDKIDSLKFIIENGGVTIPLEALHITFTIEGVSRTVTHQIVRHRRMGFGQESLRVTDCRFHDFRLPESLRLTKNEKLEDIYRDTVEKEFDTYCKLVDGGVPLEDARNILGMGLLTYIVVTTDLRTFIDYLFARTQEAAMEEHQILAKMMFEKFKETYPVVFKLLENKFPKPKLESEEP